MALCTADPTNRHGRVAYSLELLIELEQPVWDLRASELVDSWQPAELPERLARQRATRNRADDETDPDYDFSGRGKRGGEPGTRP